MFKYKLRNFIVDFALIIAAFVVQCTLLSQIPSFGCAPNLLLIITFVYGYSRGKVPGMLIGFFSGLLMDVYFCDLIGYHALVLLVIGFLSGIWSKYFYSNNLLIPMLLLLGSDVLYCVLYDFCWFVLRSRFDFNYYFEHVMFPEFLLTMIAGIILYMPLSALNRKIRIG